MRLIFSDPNPYYYFVLMGNGLRKLNLINVLFLNLNYINENLYEPKFFNELVSFEFLYNKLRIDNCTFKTNFNLFR